MRHRKNHDAGRETAWILTCCRNGNRARPHEVFEYTGIMAANTDAAGVLRDELKALAKALSAQAKGVNPQTNTDLKDSRKGDAER